MGILGAYKFIGLRAPRTSIFCLLYFISLIIIAYHNVFSDKEVFFLSDYNYFTLLDSCIFIRAKFDGLLIFKPQASGFMIWSKFR